MSYQIKNNFEKFRMDFKKDTELDSKQNAAEYIAYVNARCNDHSAQCMSILVNEIARFREEVDKDSQGIFRNLSTIMDLLKKQL